MRQCDADMAILYLGAFTPDRSEYKNAATSTAGNLFQLNFLRALWDSDLPRPTICSYFPSASFPRGKLFVGSKIEPLPFGGQVRSLPHLNLGALKILSLGLAAFWVTAAWARRHRHVARRVAIAYNLTAPPAWPIAVACRMFGVKFVPFVGDMYVPGEVVKDTLLRRLEFASQVSVLSRADGLLIANQAIVDDFVPGRQALLMEGGVDHAFLDRLEAPAAGDETFRIVFAGQLSVLNGVTLLLDTLRLLKDPSIRVTILGRGEYTDAVKAAAKRDRRIDFRGLVPHDEVVEAYSSADLLLNLRRTDYLTQRYVFPSKVIECLATGRPLLSTRTGHVELEFGRFVFLLEEETPEALAEILGQIRQIRREKREAMGARAREYVATQKTWPAQARKLSLYLNEQVFEKEAA